MKNAIFKNIFFTAIAVFLLSCVCILGVLYPYFSEKSRQDLEDQAAGLAAAMEECGGDFLSKVEGVDTRITWIAGDGTVLYDSQSDPAAMENHAGREEVRAALETGSGVSVRYSATTREKVTNYALRLRDGTVLRLSALFYSPATLVITLFTPLLAVLVLAIALSFLLAARVSRRITEPLAEIDLQNIDDRGVYEELRPLVRRIGQQNRQIYDQMAQLRTEHARQDEMRREFTANVSHELKTPLTSISGYAELIQNGMVKEEDVPRFAGTIYREAQRLIVLVNDIIRLSRLDDKDVAAERQPVDLYALCRETIVSLAPAAERKKVRFTLSGQSAVVVGIRQILGEIVYNLCDNAIKYNREGGTAAVSVTREEGFAVLRVKDNGIGIPEDQLGRVFERFYRVDKSHSKEVGGTGLGLSIVKHGAAYHGGTVSVESREGEGSLFTVRIPLPAEESLSPDTAPEAEKAGI